jgi:hypothetical protein
MANCRRVVGVVVQENPASPTGPGLPMARVRVRLLTTGLSRGTVVLDERTTDTAGRFSFDLASLDTSTISGVLEIEVYDGAQRLDVHGDVRLHADQDNRDLIVCAMRPEKCLPPSEVVPNDLFPGGGAPTGLYGFVRHVDGTALSGLKVRLAYFSLDGVQEYEIALPPGPIEVSTGTTGWFKFTSSPILPADLLVKIYDSTGTTFLGQSAVRYQFNGGAHRFEVYLCDETLRGPSEFERISTDLSKVLHPGASSHPHYVGGLDGTLLNLTMEKLVWLSARADWPLQQIADRARAETMHDALQQAGVSIPAEDLYGLLREDCPKVLHKLLSHLPSALVSAHARAIRLNVIDGTMTGSALTAELKSAQAAWMNREAPDTIGAILRLAPVLYVPAIPPAPPTVDWVTPICEEIAGFTGSDETLWTNIAAIEVSSTTIGAPAVAMAKRLVQLGTICLGSAPVVAAVHATLGTDAVSTLATWPAATWTTAVALIATGDLPDGLEGATSVDWRAHLERLLAENAAMAFPSAAVRGLLTTTSAMPSGYDVKDVLDANPTLDLRVVALTSEAFEPTSPETADAELSTLRKVQRLVRVAPTINSASAIQRLANLSVTSGQDVVRGGRARFIQRYTDDGGSEAEAEQIFAKARSQASAAASLFVAAHPALGQARLGFIAQQDASADAADIPEYDTIFTTPSGTRCAWCQSIHGPSAYLVDLLHWMSARTRPSSLSAGPETALDALLARRPDLGELPLTCENVERVLPMIDLTMEILEAKVVGASELPANSSESTTEEQLAGPQHINDAAYTILGDEDATTSFLTPFHRPLVEARAFLGQLGVTRLALMEAFATTHSLTALQLATERLGLSAEGAAAITGSGDEADYWSLSLGGEVTLGDLRRAADLTTNEVFDLLHTRAANPTAPDTVGRVVVVMDAALDPYDVSAYEIKKVLDVDAGVAIDWELLNAADYTPIRKLLRLQRATGWPLLTLDRVLLSLGIEDTSAWDGDTLVTLAGIHHLAERAGLDPVEAALWFGSLDVREDRETAEPQRPSLYARTFLNPALFSLQEQAASGFPFTITSIETPAITGGIVNDHVAKIAAVLGLSTSDLNQLLSLFDELDVLDPAAANSLNLDSLALLTRWTSLGRALSVRPAEALRLARLLDLAPSSSSVGPFTSLTVLHGFLDDAQMLGEAGWTVDLLDYLLRHEAQDRVAPTDTALQQLLGRLRDVTFSTPEGTSARDALEQQLAAGLGVDRALLRELAEGMTVSAPNPDGATSATYPLFMTAAGLVDQANVPRTTLASASIKLTANVATTEPGTLTLDTTIVAASGLVLVDTSAVTFDADTPAHRVGDDLYLRVVLPDGTAVVFPSGATVENTTTSTSVELDEDAPGTLNGPVTIEIGPFARAAVSLNDGIVARLVWPALGPDTVDQTVVPTGWDDLTRAAYPHEYTILEGLTKAVALIGRVGADADERRELRALISASWTLLDPMTLSGAAASALADDSAAALVGLVRLFRQRASLPGSAPTFAELIADGFSAANLAARTGWDETLWDDALEDGAVSSPETLEALIQRVKLVRAVGVTVPAARAWAGAGSLAAFTPALGREVVAAARARVADANAWLTVARPLRDALRKRCRDALVSHLIAQDPGRYTRADDLYQDLLIDVSANPEMLTSRIVQATLSVQLFVHRALFGLEFDENDENLGQWFNDEDRLEWDWMRTYRVWEAARKVFLYPENWIEPELRDDKTPFFKELEQQLGQGDLNEDLVEQGVLDYLDRLLTVGSLKVLAFTTETISEGEGASERLHVFARTRGEPARYWKRTRDEHQIWSPWEEVKAGIMGDHLVPVVYNRRLLLFWAEFSDGQSGVENADPSQWWDIRLAMSELRDGKWSPKVVSSEVMRLDLIDLTMRTSSPEYGDQTFYRFVSSQASGELTINVYGASSNISNAPNEINRIGSFVLNPCTMELETHIWNDEYAVEESGLVPSRWAAPGYTNGISEGTSDLSATLRVNVADISSVTGKYAGAAKTAVPLLGSMSELLAVLPSHHLHFVSQTPFFVTQAERVFFVERVADDLTATDTTTPSVLGLGAFRRGTHPGLADPGGTDIVALSEGAAESLAVLMPSRRFVSQAAATLNVMEVSSTMSVSSSGAALTGRTTTYKFTPFYHPFVCRFITEVRRDGTFALLDPDPDGEAGDLFRQSAQTSFSFSTKYAPTDNVHPDYPVEDIDFALGSAYGPYNWELFFHLPFYVANQLADAGRYADAIAWYHVMFDPRTRTTASGYESAITKASWWKVKPFLEPASAPVTDWVSFTGADGDTEAAATFERSVAAWRQDPFNPHLLARLRPGTYPRAIVMRYIDTLIAWGDSLFTQDSLETLNEATQLYVFARGVLGDPPELLEDIERPEAKSFNDLRDDLDAFSNPLVALENASFTMSGASADEGAASRVAPPTLSPYFCIPFNERLRSAWDTLDDRLFKIRNGLNINGVARTLPLFQPPIDPAMLVRAAAAGVDLTSALTAAQTTPTHRFSVLLGRAMSLAGSVRAHGQALLSALEKRDAEALALLRQRQEAAMLDAVKAVRERQIEEAEQSLESLRKSKAVVTQRKNYYSGLIAKDWLPREKNAFGLNIAADATATLASTFSAIGVIFAPLPQVTVTCCPAVEVGGKQGVDAMSSLSSSTMAIASGLRGGASALSTSASYQRRKQEWTQQHKSAELELDALEKQILGAEIRIDIARRELRNHELQIRHSAEVWSWMQSKFTNHELYNWMANQLSTLHLQCWQLALDAARKAEASYNYELGRSDRHIQSTHWDGTRKGLLAGERLAADLERMDMAYLQHDVRELELTKHISLARLDPLALAILRETGECLFELPEVLFDLDCPNHLLRRISSVALSVACVAGPYGQVNMKLTLTGAKLRRGDELPESPAPADGLTDTPAIVTSAAVEDAGLFSADPRDARYLPFERRGAISSWKLEFCNRSHPQIDWSSVSDVTVHLRYTAREGDTRTINLDAFKGGFTSTSVNKSAGYVVGLSAKRDEPDAWHLAQSEASDEVTFRFGALRKPYALTEETFTVSAVHIVAVRPDTEGSMTASAILTLDEAEFGNHASPVSLDALPDEVGAHLFGMVTATAFWPDELVVTLTGATAATLDDLIVVLQLTVT